MNIKHTINISSFEHFSTHSRSRVFLEVAALKNFAVTEKHLWWSFFSVKLRALFLQ